MRQKNLVVAGALALVLAVAAQAALACDKEKASASAGHSGCSVTQTASMHGACATKSSMVSIFKDAPGTRTEYRKVKNGVALVVTASESRYVPVVQTALLTHMDHMQAMAGTEKMSASGAHCSSEKASAQKVSSGSCSYSKTSQASVQKTAGFSCCASKGASASMQASNNMDCPDWMKVLCSADMKVTKTSKGVEIVWTSPKKDQVNVLQAAGEKLQADLAQL